MLFSTILTGDLVSNTQYELTDEHRAQIKPWTDKWVRNAMSTAPITSDDRIAMVEAVRGMYRAAGMEPPPDNRIIFVDSPIEASFLAGMAAWRWFIHTEPEKAKPLVDAFAPTWDAPAPDNDYDRTILERFMARLRKICPPE